MGQGRHRCRRSCLGWGGLAGAWCWQVCIPDAQLQTHSPRQQRKAGSDSAGTALLCPLSLNRLAFGRLVFKGMGISRPDAVIGKCRMIRHSRDRKNEPNPERCVSASRAPSPRRAVSRRERLLAARLGEQPSLSCAESTATLPAG